MKLVSTILAGISAVLCLALIFYWIRSYSTYEGQVWYQSGKFKAAVQRGPAGIDAELESQTSGIMSFQGRLTFARIVDPIKRDSFTSWSYEFNSPRDLRDDVSFLMFATISPTTFSMGSQKAIVHDPQLNGEWVLPFSRVTLPYWLFVGLTALWPWRWVSGYLQANRWARQGRCVNCGHSVKGLSGVCPVCKTPIELDLD